ncbi:sulfide/dihydroorotate dehydrogenase-like FAD/NAD-binding protein [bacterium]
MSYKILNKKILGPNLKELDIYAPEIAAGAEAGQFVVLRIDEYGERIPLSIAQANKSNGAIKIIFQETGKTTKKLGMLEIGDSIRDFLGPLGLPSDIKKYGKVICIGGGVGIAAIYPMVSALKKENNYVISILGARTKDMLILEHEVHNSSQEFYIATDDGSYGVKGFVTDILKNVVKDNKIDMVFAVGPISMMKAVFEIASEYDIPIKVSLETLMLDGIGMCGACRVYHYGKIKFTCVDGPEFDAYGLNFDDIANRQKRFKNQEKTSLDIFDKEGKCKCQKEN